MFLEACDTLCIPTDHLPNNISLDQRLAALTRRDEPLPSQTQRDWLQDSGDAYYEQAFNALMRGAVVEDYRTADRWLALVDDIFEVVDTDMKHFYGSSQ